MPEGVAHETQAISIYYRFAPRSIPRSEEHGARQDPSPLPSPAYDRARASTNDPPKRRAPNTSSTRARPIGGRVE